MLGGDLLTEYDMHDSGYCIRFVFVRAVSKPCVRTLIKTHNFVSFYKFLIHLGMHHTVKAYLHNGLGAQIYSSYYRWLLLLAAVMYVNNTDLIHWSCQPFCSLVKLIVASQTLTYAWGGLAIAMGAAIKPEKCYVYFLSNWHDCGQAKLQTVWALPESIAQLPFHWGISPHRIYGFR